MPLVNAHNCPCNSVISLPFISAGRTFVSMLLDAKADVEKKDKRGDTPLIKAAWFLQTHIAHTERQTQMHKPSTHAAAGLLSPTQYAHM